MKQIAVETELMDVMSMQPEMFTWEMLQEITKRIDKINEGDRDIKSTSQVDYIWIQAGAELCQAQDKL